MPSLLKMSPAELRVTLTKLGVLIGAGSEDHEIAAELGLDFDGLDKLKAEFYRRREADARAAGNAKAYIDYCAEQRACMNDLSDLIEEFRKTKQAAAMVSAVKARSEILDKILQRGMDLGFIEKSPDRIIGGVLVSDLSSDELRRAILDEVRMLDGMMRSHRGAGGSILDVPVGSIHRALPEGEPVPERPVKTPVKKRPVTRAKGARAKTDKVHRGRRVVKEKAKVTE